MMGVAPAKISQLENKSQLKMVSIMLAVEASRHRDPIVQMKGMVTMAGRRHLNARSAAAGISTGSRSPGAMVSG
jgi:hypothetical protein